MTKAEYINRYGIDKYEQYKEYHKEYMKERRRNDQEYQKEYQKEYNKEYRMKDLTIDGKLKDNIRANSNQILFRQRKHTKLKDYQIHHCFGYEDPSKFIYIPKSLHYKIHQYLRDNNIDADSNHYKYISTLINECTDYTYISV